MVLRRTASSVADLSKKVIGGFGSLKGSGRDLYLLYGLVLLDSYGYFSLSISFTLYLTNEFGISDMAAGAAYGMWGTLLSVYGVAFGSFVDFLGVKNILVMSFCLATFARAFMAITTSATALYVALHVPLAIATALGTPVIPIGLKRITDTQTRSVAFGLYYSIMNIAALCSGALLDTFRIALADGFKIESLGPDSVFNNGTRLILLSGSLASIAAVIVSMFLSPEMGPVRKDEPELDATEELEQGLLEHDHDHDHEDEQQQGSDHLAHVDHDSAMTVPHKSASEATVADSSAPGAPLIDPSTRRKHKRKRKHKKKARNNYIMEVLKLKEFWKFVAVTLITTNLKMVFRHVEATLPKYEIRAFGCNYPVGLVYSINPFLIIFIVPLVGAALAHVQHFDAIHYGSYLSALSPLWLVAFQKPWAPPLFIFMLSVGEAVWSPRWYDYSLSVAPEGQEGIFTALAAAPLFLAKLPTGMVSGWLLEAYCPEEAEASCHHSEAGNLLGRSLSAWSTEAASVQPTGWLQPFTDTLTSWRTWGQENGLLSLISAGPGDAPCHGENLWLIVCLLTLSSPILMLLTQRWVRPAHRDEEMATGPADELDSELACEEPRALPAPARRATSPMPALRKTSTSDSQSIGGGAWLGQVISESHKRDSLLSPSDRARRANSTSPEPRHDQRDDGTAVVPIPGAVPRARAGPAIVGSVSSVSDVSGTSYTSDLTEQSPSSGIMGMASRIWRLPSMILGATPGAARHLQNDRAHAYMEAESPEPSPDSTLRSRRP